MARDGKKKFFWLTVTWLNLSLSVFPEDWVLEHAKSEKNLYYAIGRQNLTDYIVHTPYENSIHPVVHLDELYRVRALFTKWQRELILKKCLQKIKDSEV